MGTEKERFEGRTHQSADSFCAKSKGTSSQGVLRFGSHETWGLWWCLLSAPVCHVSLAFPAHLYSSVFILKGLDYICQGLLRPWEPKVTMVEGRPGRWKSRPTCPHSPQLLLYIGVPFKTLGKCFLLSKSLKMSRLITFPF